MQGEGGGGGYAKNIYPLVWEFPNGKIAEFIIHIM